MHLRAPRDDVQSLEPTSPRFRALCGGAILKFTIVSLVFFHFYAYKNFHSSMVYNPSFHFIFHFLFHLILHYWGTIVSPDKIHYSTGLVLMRNLRVAEAAECWAGARATSWPPPLRVHLGSGTLKVVLIMNRGVGFRV